MAILVLLAAGCGGAAIDGTTYVWDDDAQALVAVEVTPAAPAPTPANPPAQPGSPVTPAPVAPDGTRADSTPDPIPARPVDPLRRCDRYADPAERDACKAAPPRTLR